MNTYYGKTSEVDFLRGESMEDAEEIISLYQSHPHFCKAWALMCRWRHHPINISTLEHIKGIREDRKLAKRLMRGLKN